jgi:endoglucanase
MPDFSSTQRGDQVPALSARRFGDVAASARHCALLRPLLLLAALLAPLSLLLTPLPVLAAPQEPIASKGIPCFHRGVAIHNMMNWAAVEPANPDRYAFPAFAGPNYETSDGLLRNVAAAGFDFVRLTIDPGPFLQFTGAKREALDQHLKAVVERLLRNGFCVIVDFHPTSQVAKYAPERLVQAEDDPLFLAYAAVIRQTAHILATLHSDRVALELMNEPQYGWDPATAARWQRLLEHLHREAKAEAPDLLLVLSGARGGDIKGLLALDPAPFAGSRVLYSFHYYEPHDFTHQGVKSTTPSAWPWRYISGLPYPAQSADPDRVWQKIQQNVLSDPDLAFPDQRRLALQRVHERVSSYIAGGFGRRQIASDFDSVRAWAELHGIDPHAILLGEFGVTRTYGMYRASDPLSQEAWLHDVRREAELHGFSWAFWALTGYGGMALVESDGGDKLNPVSLRALGLNGGS